MPTSPPSIQDFNHTYRQDQPTPFAVSATNIDDGIALWEAVGSGEWAGKFVSTSGTSAIFTPYNRTQDVVINVYDAVKPNWGTISAPQISEGLGNKLTYSHFGVPGTFYGAVGDETSGSSDECLFQAVVSGTMSARGIGLSTGGAAHYGWNDPGMNYCIALGQIGLGSIWIGGTSVIGAFSGTPGFSYKNGDVIRISVENNTVCFRNNGKLIYRDTDAPPANLHPVATFYDGGTELTGLYFWQGDYGKDDADLKVWGALPLYQDKISEHEVTEIAEVSEAEAQRGRDKVVRYHQSQDKWDLVYTGRRLDELQTMRDFRNFHRIHIPFYINDIPRGLNKLVVFDTGIKDRLMLANSFDFSCTVKEY
jgi:hypothetical protein